MAENKPEIENTTEQVTEQVTVWSPELTADILRLRLNGKWVCNAVSESNGIFNVMLALFEAVHSAGLKALEINQWRFKTAE